MRQDVRAGSVDVALADSDGGPGPHLAVTHIGTWRGDAASGGWVLPRAHVLSISFIAPMELDRKAAPLGSSSQAYCIPKPLWTSYWPFTGASRASVDDDLASLNDAFARLRADHDAWGEELEERRTWDAACADLSEE